LTTSLPEISALTKATKEQGKCKADTELIDLATQIDLRFDSYGNAFEKDVSVSVINHALVAPLASVGVKRQDSSLFLIRGGNLKKLTLVMTNGRWRFSR
jgi:hypothetical protein